jgi:D-3-phosphoglycerate dehydrogenase
MKFSVNNLNKKFSYPKAVSKFFCLKMFIRLGVNLFKEGYEVEVVGSAMSEEKLCENQKYLNSKGFAPKVM